MKPHRLYLISGRVEVRVRSIALITCWMTNEAIQEPKEGKQEMRRSRKVRKRELADRSKGGAEDGCWQDILPDRGTGRYYCLSRCCNTSFFYAFIHFLLLWLFLESTTRDCTSLEGLINESTQQRQ